MELREEKYQFNKKRFFHHSIPSPLTLSENEVKSSEKSSCPDVDYLLSLNSNDVSTDENILQKDLDRSDDANKINLLRMNSSSTDMDFLICDMSNDSSEDVRMALDILIEKVDGNGENYSDNNDNDNIDLNGTSFDSTNMTSDNGTVVVTNCSSSEDLHDIEIESKTYGNTIQQYDSMDIINDKMGTQKIQSHDITNRINDIIVVEETTDGLTEIKDGNEALKDQTEIINSVEPNEVSEKEMKKDVTNVELIVGIADDNDALTIVNNTISADVIQTDITESNGQKGHNVNVTGDTKVTLVGDKKKDGIAADWMGTWRWSAKMIRAIHPVMTE